MRSTSTGTQATRSAGSPSAMASRARLDASIAAVGRVGGRRVSAWMPRRTSPPSDPIVPSPCPRPAAAATFAFSATVCRLHEALEVARHRGVVLAHFLVDARADQLPHGDALGEEFKGQLAGRAAA